MKVSEFKSYSKASGFFLLAFFFFSNVRSQEITPLKILNSPFDEQNPVPSAAGELFYTVGFHPENTAGQADFGDIWFAKSDGKGKWEKPERISDLSTLGNDVFIGFVDPLTALVYHSGESGRKQGIHQYGRFGNSWNYQRTLEMGNFKNNGTHFSGRLSNDGKLIVMSMMSFGTYGNEDIYISTLQSESVWSSPANLGPQINTLGQETNPYLSDDNMTLYFSSNSMEKRRGKDIYFSQKTSTTWDKWTSPIPIQLVNTQGSEMGYAKLNDLDGNAIFTSTQNSEGFGDFFLVQFESKTPLVQDVITESISDLTGEKEAILDATINSKNAIQKVTANPPAQALTYSLDSLQGINQENSTENNSQKVAVSQPWHEIQILDALSKEPIGYKLEITDTRGIKKTLDNQSQAKTELEESQWEIVSVNSVGYIPQLIERNIWMEMEGKELFLKPAKAGTSIVLEKIQFNRGTSDFADSRSIQVLDNLVVFLKENSAIVIRLEGHTDNAGDPSLNKDLSMKRASKIRGYLTINGIEFERVRISGWGGTRPIADNSTVEGQELNRRVELLIER